MLKCLHAKVLLAATTIAASLGSPAIGGVIFRYDFEGANPWMSASSDVMPATPLPVEPTIEHAPIGTIVQAGTDKPSGGILLTAEVGEANGEWHALFTSGLLAAANTETNLGKLTLSFDLSTSIARPVTVRFESFDANKRRTGGLETVVYPAAPDFYVRSAIDLSTMKRSGEGTFNPADPFVQISYVMSGPAFPASASHSLRIDNVCYASPAYYVSPTGSDDNDGLTENTPFKLPQKAVDLAKPGDIVLLMDGEYHRTEPNTVQDGIMHIESAGEPDAWIVVKNYPGHTPTIINVDSWCAIRIGGTVRNEKYKDTPPAYLELRGLHVRGQADRVMANYKDDIGKPLPTTNGNGISGNGLRGGKGPHHVRIADCLAEYCPGGGIGLTDADWVTYENNVSRYNSWFTIYATSGMGTMGTFNFDTTSNVYKTLLRNNRVSWNRTYIMWKHIGKVSDGNGIIIDSIVMPTQNAAYLGRTLVQNNVATHNGGSGIHAFKAHQLDIINNTAFMNGASPELRWGQIFLQRTNDARVINNVMWARDGQPVNTVNKDGSDKGNTNITRANNVYFGGGFPPIMGTDDVVADPLFVDPWLTTWQEPSMTNFRVKPGSPALGKGRWEPITPLTDIDGNPRPLNAAPDAGAFQH
ncbi:MAG TPA: right-handed parallel beta-helix repeat-containing protein [Tepidisphaeraceae bacterium]|nr:right-handed parallel beta-helix repeat-containing protein [Tepidisphaeraceae bacterium]